MKNLKYVIVLLLIMCVLPSAYANDKETIPFNYNAPSVGWESKGVDIKKIYNVGYKILRENNIRKRMIFSVGTPGEVSIVYKFLDFANQASPIAIPMMSFNSKSFSYWPYRTIYLYPSLFSHIDNDDELAFLVAHEISHTIDFYNWYAIHRYASLLRPFSMRYVYEYRADNRAVDLMVKAGYNPMGAITYINKTSSDYGDYISTHPNGTRRMKKIFKKIRKKYPEFITSEYKDNIYFINFDKYYYRKRDKKLAKEAQKI